MGNGDSVAAYVARAQRVIHETVCSEELRAGRVLSSHLSDMCPDCGRRIRYPDGEHVIAGLWMVFGIIVSCRGRRMIPLELRARR